MSGFTLNWFLKDSNGVQVTEKLPARQEDWEQEPPRPAYKQPLLHDMIQLAMQLRLQNMTKDDILKEAIQQKSQMSAIRETDEMCLTGQVKADKQKSVFSKILFNVNSSKMSEEPSIEDIET